MVFQGNSLRLALGPVGQDDLQGPKDGHGTEGGITQDIADAVLKDGVIHGGIRLAHADGIDKVPDGHRGIAAAAHGRESGHARIVPAGDVAAFHQLAEIALRHDRTGHIQAGKLDLAGPGGEHICALFHHPVIEGTVDLILQGAHGMADPLQRIADGMGEVIHGIDAPLVAGAPVFLVEDAVHGRIPHDDVRGGHVDLHAQGLASLRELARLHAAEEVQALFGRPVAPGRVLPGLGQGAAILTHFLLAELIHIGQAAADPVLRDLIALVVIIGGIELTAGPVEAQPVDIPLDGFDILGILFGRVGIVETQVALAAVFLSGQEVHNQGFAVADMHISVRLRRETGMDLGIAFILQILIDRIPDKVTADSVLFRTDFFHKRQAPFPSDVVTGTNFRYYTWKRGGEASKKAKKSLVFYKEDAV